MISQSIRDKIETIASRYPRRASALLPALRILQNESAGRIDRSELADIAELLDVSTAHVYGVWSHYSMYNLRPVGKYHLQIDGNVPAMLAGADDIIAHLEESFGIKVGQTTDDGLFTLTKVEDLGSCGTCPVVQVNDQRYYDNMTIAKVDELIASLRKGQLPPNDGKANFASQCNVLLKRRGAANSTSINTYKTDDGYKALQKARTMEPQKVIEQVKESGLRGLGGAGFPTGMKWSFLPKDNDKPVYLICNADEGEPGTFKDRQIMEYDPHLLTEGIAIAAHAVGAELAFIYIRGEFGWIADILEAAIEEAKTANIIGDSLKDIIVHRGAGSYICGEETALIESLEGNRGCPRLKPPFPAVEGLYGCPTIVNNVETLSSLPFIISRGADAYKVFGSSNNYGPKIFGVSGHVNKPGTYEFAMGTELAKIIEAAGGVKGNLKAVIVGGLSSPILTAGEADGLKMDFDSCLEKDTMFGSGGIIVINDQTSIPQVALRTIDFYKHESCGQCVPCREGTRMVKELLKRLLQGYGTIADIDKILQICQTVKGNTLCPAGDGFVIPISAMINKFRPEFDALVKN